MNEQMLAAELFERLERMAAADSEDFATLVAILGLDPRTDFVEADLAGLALTRQNFSGCDFSGTDFSGSSFDGSGLKDCRLDGACLADASLSYMTLSGCSFRDADFSNAVFQGAVLTECDFSGANLAGAFFPKAALKNCSFAGAVLTDVRFQRAALVDVDWAGVALESVAFEECALDDTDATPIDQLTDEQVRRRFAGGLVEADESALWDCLNLLTLRPKAFDDWLGAALQLARLARRLGNDYIVVAVMDEAKRRVEQMGDDIVAVAGWLRLSKAWRSLRDLRLATDTLEQAVRRAYSVRLSLPPARILDVVEQAARMHALTDIAKNLLDAVDPRLDHGITARARMSLALRVAEGYLALGYDWSAHRVLWQFFTPARAMEWERRPACLYRALALQRRLIHLERAPEDFGQLLRLVEAVVEGSGPWQVRLSHRLRLAAECLRGARLEHAIDVLERARADLYRWAVNRLGKAGANRLVDACTVSALIPPVGLLEMISADILRPTPKRFAQIENAARR